MRSISFHRPHVNPDLCSLREASKATRLSQQDLLLLIKSGRLRFLRAGLSVWLRKEDVQHLAKGR